MSDQPNILLIMTDQHSPHFLGCAGEPIVRTPTLDRLAESGVRFTNAYCGHPLCVPSRMSFLTSRFPSDIRVWTNSCHLRSDIATFVHYLVNAGYSTTLCGRMHFTGPDQRHGYERRIIGDVDPKLEHIPLNTTGQTADGVRTAGPGRTAYTRYDEEVTQVCCRELEALDRQRPDKPFFMTVGYVLPHCPFICPKHLFDEYVSQIDVPQLPEGYLESLHPAVKLWREHRKIDGLTDEEVRTARAAYYGLVTMMDGLIGQILSTLEGTRFARDTMVVYTTDHGEMAGEHRMWWKSSFYEGSACVPLLFSWPGQFAAGRTVDSVCSLLDVGPTLVDYGGGQPMPSARGDSLRQFLCGDGSTEGWRDTAFAELGRSMNDPPGRMVRSGKFKLNHYHGYEAPQLFNIELDPREMRDLGGDPNFSEVREELLEMVMGEWSGEDVVQSLDCLEADRKVLNDFGASAQLSEGDPPDRWTAPDRCNLFPQR